MEDKGYTIIREFNIDGSRRFPRKSSFNGIKAIALWSAFAGLIGGAMYFAKNNEWKDENNSRAGYNEKAAEQRFIGYETDDFSDDSDEVLLARMIYGEARNCSKMEKIAVAYTAVNRARDGKKWNGENVRDAVLAKSQYSCFNRNDSNYAKVKNPEVYENPSVFEECLDAARGVLSRSYADPTNGATHYYNPDSASPYWAEDERMLNLGRIKTDEGLSRHVFLRELCTP